MSMAYNVALAKVLGAAHAHIEDWETGIADGIYDGEGRDDMEELRAAFSIVETAYDNEPKPKVVIEVSGGVAECVSGEDKVEVIIIDHDSDEADREEAEAKEQFDATQLHGKGGVS